MVDVRFRGVRDRAVGALADAVLPSGSPGVDIDAPGAWARVALALATSGHAALGNRVLDATVQRHLSDEGAPRSSPQHGAERLVACTVAVLSAARLGRPGLAQRVGAPLSALRDPVHGGVYTPGEPEEVTDLASTVALGLVDLTLGRTAGALASARYLAGLWAVQPHTDVVLLRRDARGGLLGVDAVEPRAGHALHVEGGCQGHGVLGAAVSFLLVLGETDPAGAPGGVEVQRLAGNILRFAARCVGNVTDPADAAELCSAAAVFGHATGDRDALDLSARLLRGLTHQQDVDGLFRQHLDSASERAERTARVAAALSEAALGAAPEGPREVPDGAPDGVRVVLCNAPGDKVQALADALLSERLAACVNVIPVVESAYEWKGRFEREPEATMLIKTTRGRVAALTARLRALHPYELPEVLSLAAEPSEGNADYAAWVRGQVRPRQG